MGESKNTQPPRVSPRWHAAFPNLPTATPRLNQSEWAGVSLAPETALSKAQILKVYYYRFKLNTKVKVHSIALPAGTATKRLQNK